MTSEGVPEAAGLERDLHYKDIVEGSLQGIVIQQDGRVVYANAAMARLFGYADPRDLIGLNPFEDLIDAEDVSEFRERTAAVYRNEKVSQHPGWRARRRDRESVWIASTAHRTEWKGQPAVVSFYLDITERKKAEFALRESEARYRAALTAGRMGAWETDLVGRRRVWTPEGMQLFGLSLPGGIGRVGGDSDEYVAAIHPDDRGIVATFYQQADRMDGFPAEYRIVRPDGKLLWLSGWGQVVDRAADGQATRLISIMTDISDRKAMELRLHTLMGELAHRSANLMTVIQSIARKIGRQAATVQEFQSEFEGRLKALATSQNALTGQTGSSASLRDLICEQLRPFAAAGPALELEGPETHLSIEATRMIGLALHELATNALKHGAWSVPDGKVSVRWTYEPLDDGAPGLTLTWSEQGGPPATPSVRKGFGNVVLYQLIPQSLRGSARGEFLERGFSWTMSAPRSRLTSEIGG